MKHKGLMLTCLTLLNITLFSPLFADSNPNPYSCVIDPEFGNTDLVYAPLAAWAAAGSNAIIDSVFTINVVSIPDSMTYESGSIQVPIPNAQSGDGFDNATTFNLLISWLKDRPWLQNIHAQINIPPGIYNFSDQIVMQSNISLKGAGSHQTELRFLIRADSTSSTMSETDCRKDVILVSGTDDAYKYNCGIEDLKIVRIRDGLTTRAVKEYVGDYSMFDGTNDYSGYWGNNIAIRRATDCWVKGVESENTFRNHVTLEFSNNITISGVYFHDANDYGNGGYGYGVGLWDSCNNKVENSIFRHVRHAVTIVDKSWFNVIAYNYVREQHSTELVPYIGEISTHWSDITIHGEATNTYFHNHPSEDYTYNADRKPYYNLVEGNDLEYLCVDATHMYNGTNNTFLRNRVTEQMHVQGSYGFTSTFLGLALDSIMLLCADPLTATAWILFTLPGFFKHTCVDCLALRANDAFADSTDNFRNQPRQLFVNNYARECNWWKS